MFEFAVARLEVETSFVFFECVELFEEALGGAHRFVGAEFGGWGEETVLGIVGDFRYELGGCFARV